MVDFPFVTSYAAGTASVEAGSTTVTGQNTFWKDNSNPELSPIRAGDLFGTHKGYAIRIEEVVSATEVTLAYPWPGVDQATAEYEIQLTPRIVGSQQATRLLQKQLSSGNISAFAELEGESNVLPMFTGAGTMDVITRQSLVSGAAYDVQVANLAARAAYDLQAKDFAVLVSNIGDGRAALYSKLSSSSGDWSPPAFVTGPVGPVGIVPKGAYNGATAYAKNETVTYGGSTWVAKIATTGNPPPTLPTTENTQWYLLAQAGRQGINDKGTYAAGTQYSEGDSVLDNGSTWFALQATIGNAPPVLPTTSNAYWRLLARRGIDGAGTGDVVGPASVTAGNLVQFADATGKLIGRATIGSPAFLGRVSPGAGDVERLGVAQVNQALGGWEPIVNIDVTGQTVLLVQNLSAFSSIRVTADFYIPLAEYAAIQVSADNGSTFLAGNNDYQFTFVDGGGANVLQVIGNLPGFTVGNGLAVSQTILGSFNKSRVSQGIGHQYFDTGGGRTMRMASCAVIGSTSVFNAFRIRTSSVSAFNYGSFFVEGIRG